jgi:hypothetical protein
MTEVTIRPTRVEWWIAGEQYETLAEALRHDGYSVRLVHPDDVEKRGWGVDVPTAAEAASSI